MTTPPPNYKKGVGRLATDRYDFQAHLDGVNPPGFTDFRHTADETDMNPPVIGGATTVQSSLNNIAAFIAAQSGVGQGFITVGDGYDTWHAANGNINYDPLIPSLDLALNPIFNAMIAGTPVPAGFERIQRGGIVVIKTGTYIVRKTINVPPGVILIGEGYGTKIVNATNLTLTPLPPVPTLPVTVANVSNSSPMIVTTTVAIPGLVTGDTVNIHGVVMSAPLSGNRNVNGSWVVNVTSPTTFQLNGSLSNGNYTSGGGVGTNAPLFRIAADNNRAVNDTPVDPNLFMFSRETKIMNMVISDNFIENTILGDIYYKLPQNKSSSAIPWPSSLILQESGSNLSMSQVTMMGRVNFSSPGVVSQATGSAVQVDFTTPATTGTILKISDCFIDGFNIPIIFYGPAGGADYYECSGSKIRGYGYYNGDGSSSAFNTIMVVNDNTSKITNNILYGNGANMQSAVFVSSIVSSPPTGQARGKLLVAMNDIIVNKASGSLVTFSPIKSAGLATTAYLSYMSYGNNLQDKFTVGVDVDEGSAPPFFIDAFGQVTIANAIIANSNVTTETVASLTTNTLQVNTSANLSATTLNGTTTVNGATTFNSSATITSKSVDKKTITIINSAGSYNVDSNYTVAYDYCILATVGGVGIILPQAAFYPGRTLIIKDTGNSSATNPLVISPALFTSDAIDGVGTYTLPDPYSSVTLISDGGSNWYIV